MAVVTDYLNTLIAKQVEDHKLVVWYDPERYYAEVVAQLNLPDTAISCYDGSFFQLRREIDHLLNGEQPPRLVIYVSEQQSNTQHALIELEAAGVVIQPGEQPPQRNTRLAVVARNALKSVLGEEIAADIERQVETGKLSLADLNALADRGGEISSGVLSLVFGTGNPQEVALAFLNSDRLDGEIEKKSATRELAGLLRTTFEIELPEQASLAEVREKLARYVLLTEFKAGLGDSAPSQLFSAGATPNGLGSCVRLARTWRQVRDSRDSYVAAAMKIEQEFSLGQIEFHGATIAGVETFLAVERALIRSVERKLLEAADPNLLDLARSRQSRFWADVNPAIQAHWALIASAAAVLLEADRVAGDLKKAAAGTPALVQAYAGGESPWCLLDTHHRHMESRWHNFDPGEEHEGLERLVVKARQRYSGVGSELARRFITQFQQAKHPIGGVLHQRDVFEKHVRPRLGDARVACVWIDGLRFEMARELCEVLRDDFQLDIQPALASIPTITEIGMASLLPKAAEGKVVAVGGGKLGLEIDGTLIKDRKDRIAFLKSHAGVPVFDAKLDDLLPKPTKRVRDGIKGAQLVLITSQEIDELCEKDNITQARRQMDGVLTDLRRGVRVLSKELGVGTIILAADHGHLFGEEISDDMKIESPGGDIADLHRRVWIGVGGTSEPSYLRASLESLGVQSELDIATPWTFACFKSKGGARAYFHGGLSPQELIVPVVVMTPTARALAGPSKGIDWKLTTGTPKLTTRFFSVQIAGQQSAGSLFGLELPKVRVEIRAKGKCVSRPVSASYGFEDATGEVQLRTTEADPKQIEPNTVALMVDPEQINQKTVSVVLVDAASGAELRSLDKIEFAISI